MIWLVTGGCGFVGTNLVDALLHDGEEVVVFDRLSRLGSRENLEWLRNRHGREWQFIEGDVRDADLVEKVIVETQPVAIAHLAGQVAMTTSIRHPRLDFETNALGTFNVLEAVRCSSLDSIVLYSSTNKVYGDLEQFNYIETPTRYEVQGHEFGFDESLPLDGSSPYGCSKLAAEQYCRDYHRVFGLPTVVFRHSSMYGGRQFATYDQGWISWFVLQAARAELGQGERFTISGNGKQVRDVLHADDLVRLYRSAAASIDTTQGEIFNIGGGASNSLSLLELFSELERLTNVKLEYEQLPTRHSDQRVFVADHRKATATFEWRPRVSSDEGLRRQLAWTRQLLRDNSTRKAA